MPIIATGQFQRGRLWLSLFVFALAAGACAFQMGTVTAPPTALSCGSAPRYGSLAVHLPTRVGFDDVDYYFEYHGQPIRLPDALSESDVVVDPNATDFSIPLAGSRQMGQICLGSPILPSVAYLPPGPDSRASLAEPIVVTVKVEAGGGDSYVIAMGDVTIAP